MYSYIKKSCRNDQCHLDKDINKGAKKTDRQRKVVSFLLSREISTNRYAKQTDGSICFRKVYNTIVRLHSCVSYHAAKNKIRHHLGYGLWVEM